MELAPYVAPCKGRRECPKTQSHPWQENFKRDDRSRSQNCWSLQLELAQWVELGVLYPVHMSDEVVDSEISFCAHTGLG
jgi:hypothetical protein